MKKTRGLTTGEIELAKTVFGDSIDYSKVKIKSVPFLMNAAGMSPDGNIYVTGKASREDFSACESGLRAFFIHEMVHVWQRQNCVLDPVIEFGKEMLKHKFNYANAYKYELGKGRDFTSFGMEQQASIIEDYFLIAHEGYAFHKGKLENDVCDLDEKLALYKDVLKDFLQDPGFCKRASLSAPFPHKKPDEPKA